MQRHATRPTHQRHHTQRNVVAPQHHNNNYNKMLSSSHSSPQREISVASPRRVALDTTASGSTSGFGFSRGKRQSIYTALYTLYVAYTLLFGAACPLQ